MKKKDFSRRKFVKLSAGVPLSSALFPGCSLKRVSSQKNILGNYRSYSSDNTYDYIFVGSGAGGGPVAARLVQAGFRALLLEAGGRETSEVIEVPAYHGLSTEDPTYSWEFFVQHYENRSKQFLSSKYDQTNGGIFYPRATGLGGCTIHNAMITMYPNNSDWEHLVNVTGDESWNPRSMRKYFQKMERNNYYNKPLESRSKRGLFNREKMGFNGWLSTE